MQLSVATSMSTAQARATPSWLTHNKCCPHSLLPGIKYSRHVTPSAITRVPHYRLKSIKAFSVITSCIPLKKACIMQNIWHFSKSFIPQWHVRSVPLLCFFQNCDATNNRRSDFKISSITFFRYNRLVYRMTPWVSVRLVQVLQCSTGARHVISGKRRNHGMYCHVV